MCSTACERNGLLCDSGESRTHPQGILSQTTQSDLEARMHEANANDVQGVFQWPGTCTSWVAQQWSALPFYQTGNGKCFSSGLNSANEYGYYCPYVNTNTGHRLCKHNAIELYTLL